MEEVIKEFNLEMELSEERIERLRTTVMNEAKAVVAKLEEAEASRKEELGRKMNQLIEKLTNDLRVIFLTKKFQLWILFLTQVMGQQEEELRQFSYGLALFYKDFPMK